MRHTRSIVVMLAILVTLVVAAGGCRPAGDEPARRTGPPLPVAGKVEIDKESAGSIEETPFVLTDQTGAEFRSEALAGKVWMGAIFFSNCPGPCFRENQAIADLVARIDHPDFMVVSLTCDPTTDTPEVLRRYADRFEADPDRWKFLTGDLEVIKQVGQETFKLPVELGVHSERGVVFDRQGRLRGGYHLLQEDRVKELEKLIREVLAEEASAP
jgi:cytochrome oxidase Cu insertion factor (SCO1/SenC/PrrC family)